MVAAATPVVGQQQLAETEEAVEKEAEANEQVAQSAEESQLLAAIRQEKEADKKLQEKILEAIVNTP
jgi:hypothetical protein